MRIGIVTSALALTLMLASGAAAQSADDKAIRKLADDFTTAINKGDTKTAMALMTADGDYLSSTGRWSRGSAEVGKMVSEQAAGAFKGLTFKTTITDVRMIKPDVAIASGTFESSTRKGNATYIAVREGTQWKIAGVRAMVPAPK